MLSSFWLRGLTIAPATQGASALLAADERFAGNWIIGPSALDDFLSAPRVAASRWVVRPACGRLAVPVLVESRCLDKSALMATKQKRSRGHSAAQFGVESIDAGVDDLSPVDNAYRDQNGHRFTEQIEKVWNQL